MYRTSFQGSLEMSKTKDGTFFWKLPVYLILILTSLGSSASDTTIPITTPSMQNIDTDSGINMIPIPIQGISGTLRTRTIALLRNITCVCEIAILWSVHTRVSCPSVAPLLLVPLTNCAPGRIETFSMSEGTRCSSAVFLTLYLLPVCLCIKYLSCIFLQLIIDYWNACIFLIFLLITNKFHYRVENYILYIIYYILHIIL